MTCEVKLYENFLIDNDCDALLKKFGTELATSTTLGEYVEGYRTAENTWISNHEDPIVKEFMTRVALLTGTPVENQESPNLVKYEIGGEYKHHHDYFHPNTDYYEECIAQGGQRTHSAILYLNDDFTGGETDFPDIKTRVTPKKGLLCIWNNINHRGDLEPSSFHAGLPVITGRKWILISWIRERKFG